MNAIPKCALLAALVVTTAVPQLAQAYRSRKAAPDTFERVERRPRSVGLAATLERITEQHGRSAYAFEALRLLYRYGTERYGERGPAINDRIIELAMRRARKSRGDVRRLFEEHVLPYEANLRSAFHPAFADLPFWADLPTMRMAAMRWKAAHDDDCGDAAPADPTQPFGYEDCEVPGDVFDPKWGSWRPTLHSAYEHTLRNVEAVIPGIGFLPQCDEDADCADMNDVMHAHCGQGLTAADYANDTEVIGTIGGLCTYGAQWMPDTEIKVQGRGFYDVDAMMLLVRMEDEHGVALTSGVHQSASGHVWVDLPDGQVQDAATSPHARYVTNVHVSGGAAAEYLESTLQTELYHRPNWYLGYRDLLRFRLPADLPPGKYAMRMLSSRQTVEDALPDSGWKDALVFGFGDMDWLLSNPVDVRVMGDQRGPESLRYSIPQAKVTDTQEDYDEPSVGALVYKITPPPPVPGATPADIQIQLEQMAQDIENDIMPMGLEKLLESTTGELPEVDDGDTFDVPGVSITTTLEPGQALLAFTEMWEIDGDQAPGWFTTGVAGLTAVVVAVAQYGIAEVGLSSAVEFCVEGYTCIIVVAVLIVLAITVLLWDFFDAHEYLGLSVATYPYDVVRMTTRAHDQGWPVDWARLAHESGSFIIPSLFPSSMNFAYPDEDPNVGSVDITVDPKMDGEDPAWSINGGFSSKRYDEIRKVRSVNHDALFGDDTATYRLNVRIESLNP